MAKRAKRTKRAARTKRTSRTRPASGAEQEAEVRRPREEGERSKGERAEGTAEAAPTAPGAAASEELAADELLIVPVRNMVLFPGVALPLMIGRQRSVETIRHARELGEPLGLVLQRDEAVEEPGPDELFRVGTIAELVQVLGEGGPQDQAVCRGVARFRVKEYVRTEPWLVAKVERIEEPTADENDTELRALFHALKQQALEALRLAPGAPEDLGNAVQAIGSPGMLADLVATFLDAPPAEKQEVLEAVELLPRLRLVTQKLGRMAEVLRLSAKIRAEASGSIEKAQREYILREQLRAIRRELGELDERSSEVEELRGRIEAAGMPEEVREEVEKELRRFERTPEGSMELSVIRNYLDLMLELPWSIEDEPTLDLAQAARVLDEDHYGLEEVKRRILEYLAVHKLKPDGKHPSLCLVGPPGVGKTSLGRSIARAMGRRFVRQSLGGVHDEAEIRGHRRTYVGAMPGAIVQGLRRAGTRNPVFLLDEMDKLGRGLHGDPAAALLEVLDPEQNSTFRDNYLGVDFDLSRVLFIGTANVLDGIPGPLRDRFEVIRIPGYTREEKLEIARRYLIPRQRENVGLAERQLAFDDAALRALLDGYTREAGVRQLERTIASVARHVATLVAKGERRSLKVRKKHLGEILGPPRHERETRARTSIPGVATGLAWTPTGGEILFIEAAAMPGKGHLILTGQLGDVMRESARTALSLVRAAEDGYGRDAPWFESHDLHLHVPAGAIPKDGPSAGVAMFTALVSLLTGRRVRANVAMTGEISLRGLVLPVGGIKEKVLGALAAGIRTVVLPERNRADAEEVPASAREDIELVFVERVEEVLEAALGARARVRREAAAARAEAHPTTRRRERAAREGRGQ